MSGYGLREQWEAGHSLRHERLWRDDALLHQLTLNGSLLLVANHDRLWQALISDSLAQSPDSTWDRQRELLRLLPAPLARRALWRASYRWWVLNMSVYIQTAQLALRHGILDRWAADSPAAALWRRIERTGQQLIELEWCDAGSDADQQAIAVADLREARRQAERHRARQRRQKPFAVDERHLASGR